VQGMKIKVIRDRILEKISFTHYIRCVGGRRGFI